MPRPTIEQPHRASFLSSAAGNVLGHVLGSMLSFSEMVDEHTFTVSNYHTFRELFLDPEATRAFLAKVDPITQHSVPSKLIEIQTLLAKTVADTRIENIRDVGATVLNARLDALAQNNQAQIDALNQELQPFLEQQNQETLLVQQRMNTLVTVLNDPTFRYKAATLPAYVNKLYLNAKTALETQLRQNQQRVNTLFNNTPTLRQILYQPPMTQDELNTAVLAVKTNMLKKLEDKHNAALTHLEQTMTDHVQGEQNTRGLLSELTTQSHAATAETFMLQYIYEHGTEQQKQRIEELSRPPAQPGQPAAILQQQPIDPFDTKIKTGADILLTLSDEGLLFSPSGYTFTLTPDHKFSFTFPPHYNLTYHHGKESPMFTDIAFFVEQIRLQGHQSITMTFDQPGGNEEQVMTKAKQIYDICIMKNFDKDKITLIVNGKTLTKEDLDKYQNTTTSQTQRFKQSLEIQRAQTPQTEAQRGEQLLTDAVTRRMNPGGGGN